ncbi:MAG TPA: hypothetical protein VH643_30490 [Gemmataceae bacterium]
MSMRSASPSVPVKTELETVVRWPMLYAAAGLGFLLLAVPVVLACIAALKGNAVKDETAVRSAPPALAPVHVAPVAAPARPIASYEPKEVATPLPIYKQADRPPIKFSPAPPPAPVAAAPPPLDPVLQLPDVKEPPSIKRLNELSEYVLSELLAKEAKEVDLESAKGTRDKLLAEARETKADKKSSSAILALRTKRADLKGLPMIGEEDCRARAEDVKKMQTISLTLRRELGFGVRVSRSMDLHSPRTVEGFLAKRDDWLKDDGLSTLVQMVQVEDPLLRRELAKRIATVSSPRASVILAQTALFDLSAEVREQAINGLKDRPREQYRRVLLGGLRYPWPPVAAHAAEALVALNDRAATFRLAALLDEPEPCEPVCNSDGKWVVREVVRVNHLRNCLLCHAPSTAKNDPLRGIVPTPGQPLPQAYYSGRRGEFVRADVTYLRQDFSVMQRVAKPDRWPEWQRFDYLVRSRELTADEVAVHRKKPRPSPFAPYPQRDAVRFALSELTGLDAGEQSADWWEVLTMMGP